MERKRQTMQLANFDWNQKADTVANLFHLENYKAGQGFDGLRCWVLLSPVKEKTVLSESKRTLVQTSMN